MIYKILYYAKLLLLRILIDVSSKWRQIPCYFHYFIYIIERAYLMAIEVNIISQEIIENNR